VVGVVGRRWWPALLCVVLGLGGVVAGVHAWRTAVPRHLGPYQGWVELMSDPTPIGSGTRVTVSIDGERFDTWLYGGRRATMGVRQAGEWAWVVGERQPSGRSAHRDRLRHVVGRFRLDALGDVAPGNGLARASNRVRAALQRTSAHTMPADEAALFTGLVIGDDARQPAWLLAAFRTSGLSHLTAVSGQNVSYLIAGALPLLRRLRPWPRWLATIGLIGWFMALTRFEPSVLRAGVMAIIATTAFVLGRQPHPVRLVGLAVAVLVLLDPMLVWSVGFWLSVGATLGVCIAGPWWAARVPGPSWLRLTVGVTLGAQTGVALPSLLVFGRLPVVSVVANVAAVPVAGLVMLYGLPAGLFASYAPRPVERIVMAPAVLGTRWVATVARVAAAIEPSPVWSWSLWTVGVAGLLLSARHRSRVARADVPI
jgi:competence protein ComEC